MTFADRLQQLAHLGLSISDSPNVTLQGWVALSPSQSY